MKQHNLDPDAQMRLLEEIYGEKAIVSAVERKPSLRRSASGKIGKAKYKTPCGRCAAPPALAGCGYCCRSFESEEENFLDLTWVFPKALLS